jgi:hypothetical protein
MMNVMQAIEQTLPPASANKTIVSADAEDTAEEEVDELATTISEIDRLISDVVAKKDVAAAPDKGKNLKMPLQKIKILTFAIWVAKNFPKRTNQN